MNFLIVLFFIQMAKKVSIEQQAVNWAGERENGAGHGYPSFEARLLEKGFIKGYKTALENEKISKEDINHLKWIFDRLKDFHNENENIDYMIKFKEIIKKL
jgi:hypothetical protein